MYVGDIFNVNVLLSGAVFRVRSGRLLNNISFALNYYFDGYNVLGFHLVNILLHALACFTFYLVARESLALLPAAPPRVPCA